jgi:aspartate/methionine/tyrosine aminotransferase
MNKLQQYTFVCAPSFSQFAILGKTNLFLKKEIERYKKKRDFVYESLKDLYELNIPEGAFYAFVKIPKNQKDFIKKLIKEKLLVVPGEVFSQKKNYFRISFAVPDRELKKGIEILRYCAK